MDIEIRDYLESDLDSVNHILSEAFNQTKNNFNIPECREVVACTNNLVVGYLLLTKVLNPIKNRYYYLVDYVCVDSDYRGNGIGEKMLQYIESIARNDNAMYLQLSSSRFREAAHRLYEKCGYVKRDSDIFRKELV